MKVDKTDLEGVLKITPPTIFEDFRGTYIEMYNEKLYREAGIEVDFVQDDISHSTRHVLRGFHGDQVTWKLISCLYGCLYVAIVNNDKDSPQYKQWTSFTISDHNHTQILIPPKHGLGFVVMSDSAIFHYKQSTYYDRPGQFTLMWNDPELGVWWPIDKPVLSMRDADLKEKL